MIYLFSDAFSLFPPYLKSPNQLTLIDERKSGPALTLDLPPAYECEEKICLGAGNLRYMSFYQNPDTDELYKTPETLKETFKEIRKLIQHKSERYYARARLLRSKGWVDTIETFWIAPHAVQLLRNGQTQIRINGVFQDWNALSKKRPARV